MLNIDFLITASPVFHPALLRKSGVEALDLNSEDKNQSNSFRVADGKIGSRIFWKSTDLINLEAELSVVVVGQRKKIH